MIQIKKLAGKFFSLLALAGALSCSNEDEQDTAPLELYTLNIGGLKVSENLSGIPVNTEITLSFSLAVNPEAFMNAVRVEKDGNAVPFSLQMSNGSSKASVLLSALTPQADYTFNLSPGRIGQQGELLKEGVNFSFRTGNGDRYNACTTGTEGCLKQLTLSSGGNSYTLPYYSNYDTEADPNFVWEDLQQLIVVVHGQNRDADAYFSAMNSTLSGTSLQQNTLVIAPKFGSGNAAQPGELGWGSNWRFGGQANNSGANLSAFEVADQLIGQFTNLARFPNLKRILVTGHSSGATFAHYYGLTNQLQNSLTGVSLHFSVLNSQYFYYAGADRYNEGSGSFEVPADCAGIDSWPYGYNFAPAYIQQTGAQELQSRMGSVAMAYFLGDQDTATGGDLNTADCQAVSLGSNRYQRGLNYQRYLDQYLAGHAQTFTTVPGIAHDFRAMYASSAFKAYLEEVVKP